MHQEVMPSPKLGRSWLICMTASLFFFYIFVLMTMFNAINPHLMRAFHITDAKIGLLFSAYYYANCVLVFPAGILLDRYSTRKLIILFTLASAVCIGVFSMTSSYNVALACRFLIGISGAFALVSCLRLASRWFPSEHMALISGSMITMGFLGGMVSQTPLIILTGHLGWRHAMQSVAGLGVVFAILMFFILKDHPEWYQHDVEEVPTLMGLWHSIKNAVTRFQNWLFGIYVSLLNLPIWLLGAVWGTMLYTQAGHFTEKQASYITSMLFVGAMIGSPLFGWISDRMRSRRIPMFFGAVLSLVTILIIIYIHNGNITMHICLSFLLGLITSAQVLGYPAISESNPPAFVGGALGMGSMLIMAGGLVGQLFGWMMDKGWHHVIVHEVPWYPVAAYKKSLLILPIAMIVCIIIAFVVRETYPERDIRT